MVAQYHIEVFGLLLAVDEMTVRPDAWHAEIIRATTERHYEDVVIHFARIDNHRAFLRPDFAELDATALTVQPAYFAGQISEPMFAGVREIDNLLLLNVTRTCGDGVQHRLPDVRGTVVDQRDSGAAAAA